jgi:hypothetical protein
MHRYKQLISLGIVFLGSMSFLDVPRAQAQYVEPQYVIPWGIDATLHQKPEQIRPDLYPEQAEEGRSDDPLQGAISWSDSTGRYGWVSRYDDYYAAGKAAVQECGVSDCDREVFTRFGALAESSDNGFNFRLGSTQEEAAQYALEACQLYSDIPDTCEVLLIVGSKEGAIFEK